MHSQPLTILEGLNPADSFTLAMDEEIRRDGLAGSYGCVGLTLDGPPNIEILQQRITEFSQQFPLVTASLQQQGCRFYWCQRQQPLPLFYQHDCPDNQSENTFQQHTIKQIINHQQPRQTVAPITFHLLNSSTQYLFFIRWIHPLLDARGADLILKYLCTDCPEQRQQFGQPESKPLVFAQLDKYRWWQKINLLIKGKRYIDRLDQLSSIQPFDTTLKAEKLNYSIQRLSIEQTEQVLKQARKYVGLTSTSLYYIGCLMRALDKINPDSVGEAYCTPYAFNLRRQRALTPITGNHVCALFAQAPRQIVRDRQQLFHYLKQQNTEVIRQQQDYAFLPLMWAGSWLSLEAYGKILRLTNGSGNERSSFWFSDIGRMDLSANHFPGTKIKSVFHICQVTTPPGLAFLTGIFQNQLTLNYSFVEPLTHLKQIEILHQQVLNELLEQD